jgi:diaminohydroxyphosphoribosylaminopyrimidine deaminase/5-amino-6-(5-phosphoribosylamino)uracil reductase
VVWTRSGKLPRALHLFSDAQKKRTLVFRDRPLAQVLDELGAREVSHLLIEGGGRVLTEAFRAGLVNEVAFFIAPLVLGTEARALGRLDAAVRLGEVRYEEIGGDLLCRAVVTKG